MIREKGLLPQDFALPGDYALPAGDHATFRSAAACPKTNIWHFNGCGSESSDGHAYDTGFFSSTTKGHTVSAALPPALAEQMQIYQEMKQMADAFKTMFGREGPGVSEVTSSEVCVGCLFFKDRAPDGSFFKDRAPYGTRSEVTRRTRNAVLNTDGASDSVPSWIRKEFCHQVELVWSDHLPIAVSITMPRCQRSPGTEPEPQLESRGAC